MHTVPIKAYRYSQHPMEEAFIAIYRPSPANAFGLQAASPLSNQTLMVPYGI